MTDPLLQVRGLRTTFPAPAGGTIVAVDGIDLDLAPGECLGIVGESGSGKSVAFLSVLGLVRAPGRISVRSIRFEGREISGLAPAERRALRGSGMALAMQDALAALNPALTIGTQLIETLRAHAISADARAARAKAISLLRDVGIPSPETRIDDYPHQLSGGMRQRAMIAVALAAGPRLLIADEPTTALDATIRAQILDLLEALRRRDRMAVVLISHDIGMVAERCARSIVMYGGQIVESGATQAVVDDPRHPYTCGLLASLPRLDTPDTAVRAIPGNPPDPAALPAGCRFAPRCPMAGAGCEAPQSLTDIGGGRSVRCHRAAGSA
jgi:oligopeptide/dipeptide ABC transporter ATP-binding protein